MLKYSKITVWPGIVPFSSPENYCNWGMSPSVPWSYIPVCPLSHPLFTKSTFFRGSFFHPLPVSWLLLNDWLTTKGQLPENCLETAWQLPDNNLTTVWQLPILKLNILKITTIRQGDIKWLLFYFFEKVKKNWKKLKLSPQNFHSGSLL